MEKISQRDSSQEHQTLALGTQPLSPGCDGRSAHLTAARCLGLNGLDDRQARFSFRVGVGAFENGEYS